MFLFSVSKFTLFEIHSGISKNSHPRAIFRPIFRIPRVVHGTEYTFRVRHHGSDTTIYVRNRGNPNAEPFGLAG